MRADRIAGPGRVSFDGNRAVIHAGAEWQSGVDGDMGDAGQGADRGQQPLDKRAFGGVVLVALPRKRDLPGEDVGGVEPGGRFEHMLQAEAEQAGARQKHEGERDLRDDEAVAQALGRAAGGAAAGLGLPHRT